MSTAQTKTCQDLEIHPIFRQDNFSPELDYEAAFQEAALLASRLLQSQQSYHWLFALCFGKNKISGVPYVFGDKLPPNIPEEYTTDKGIGDLTDEDIRAVDGQLFALSRRVHFTVPVEHLKDGTVGETRIGDAQEGQQGCPSTIWIEIDFYDAMIQSGGKRSSSERALLLFAMATTLLHEMAHAAHMHIMGPHPEDLFEDALIREAGFDYVSRIFGMEPNMVFEEPLASTWHSWQNVWFLEPGYPVKEFCRNAGKLATDDNLSHCFDVKFAELLLDDGWWKDVADRSVDLIPGFLYSEENAHLLATAPASFRAWLQSEICGVRMYAKRRRQLRITEAPTTTTTAAAVAASLTIRQPASRTPTSNILEVDPSSTFKNGILYYDHSPPPFRLSAEGLRDIIPVRGGIQPIFMHRLFKLMFKPHEEQEFIELVLEVCRFDEVGGRLVLRQVGDVGLDRWRDEVLLRCWMRGPIRS
jgi:hypothetical protein